MVIVFLARRFGTRLTIERRRLLPAAAVFAAVMGTVGAAWRFSAGPLPRVLLVIRDSGDAFVYFAAGRAAAQLCPTGFRHILGNVTAALACVSAFCGVEGLLGVRIPVVGSIADVGAWLGAVVALAVVPRRAS